MKKIIAAFDGLNYSFSTEEYALFFARHINSHLVGVFLNDFTRHSYGMADIAKYEGEFDKYYEELNEADREERSKSVERFEQQCEKAGLNFSVHRDKNIAIQELLHESIYSDLMILNGAETLTRFQETAPSRFVRDLLTDVQCPVLITPSKYKPIEKIILLYNGEPSSVFAVKMFDYVLPCFSNVETEILSVRPEDESFHLPDNRLMKEFMKRHYPGSEYIVLKGPAEDTILSYLSTQKKNVLLVLGAYRRSRVSRWFKPSMADVLLKHINVPLFIAHNK